MDNSCLDTMLKKIYHIHCLDQLAFLTLVEKIAS